MNERYVIRIQASACKKIEIIEVAPHIRDSTQMFRRYLQNMVSGHVQVVPIREEGFLAAVNEESKMMGLLHNRWVEDMTPLKLNGNVVIMKSDEDQLACLSADDIRLMAEWL